MAKELKEKAEVQRREAIMEDLKARGIMKDRTPEEMAALEKAQANDDSPPWMLIIPAVVGILVLMVSMGLGIAYVIIKYADVSGLYTGQRS